MEDAYPTFFTWVLRVIAGTLVLFALLVLTPIGKEIGKIDKRANAVVSFLIFAGIAWGISYITMGSRAADGLKEANRNVAIAQQNYDQADAEYRAATGATGPRSATTYSECVGNGVAYFQEIESWPKLSDGRDARSVAAERCNRTTGAFDGLQ